MTLNPKQEKFCLEYMVDMNGTQAAIRAGYSPKTANRIAAENLLKPDIRSRINELIVEASAKVGLTIERVLEELQLIAFQDISNYVDVDAETGAIRMKGKDEWPAGTGRGIRKIKEHRTIRRTNDQSDDVVMDCTFEVELWNKNDALKELRDHLKPLSNVPPEQKVQIEIVNRTPEGRVKKNT